MPDAWVERLFLRLATMYGKHWHDQWASTPVAEVKRAWARALVRFEPEAMRRAIDHCESNLKFPPTLPEFVGLCRDFRGAGQTVALPPPRGKMTDHVAAEIAKLSDGLAEREHRDCKAWARKILERHQNGDRTLPNISLEFAREALGITA